MLKFFIKKYCNFTKSYLQINKKRVCLFIAKVAKTKNSGTYKNLVGATNYYKAVFISNVLQIPYGGYLNTTFNNAPVQIVNYASEGFWQIGIGNN